MKTDHPQPLRQEVFDWIYARAPRLCVDLAIATPNGILLTRRALPSWHDTWHFPGGTMLFGESVHDVAVRIARNELGIKVHLGPLIGYIEYPSRENGWPVSLVFLATMEDPKARIALDHQASAHGFFRDPPDPMLEHHGDFFFNNHPVLNRAVDSLVAHAS